jgi:surfeit locus 1 family protein
VNKSLWLEPAHTTVEGYVSPIPPAAANDPEAVNNPRAVRWLDATRIASLLPYPAAPFQLIDLSPGTPDEGAPTRLTVPAMDEGPHRNYAIQWFTFALIALYGSGYLIWLERGKKPGFLVTGNGQAG